MSHIWIFRLNTSNNFARHVLKWDFLVIFKHCVAPSNQSNFKLDLAIRSIGFSFPYKTQKAYQTLKTVASFSSNCCGSFMILKNSQQVDFQHSWTKRLNHIFCAVHKARKISNRTFISWSTNNYQPTQRGFPYFKKSRNVVRYHTLWVGWWFMLRCASGFPPNSGNAWRTMWQFDNFCELRFFFFSK